MYTDAAIFLVLGLCTALAYITYMIFLVNAKLDLNYPVRFKKVRYTAYSLLFISILLSSITLHYTNNTSEGFCFLVCIPVLFTIIWLCESNPRPEGGK